MDFHYITRQIPFNHSQISQCNIQALLIVMELKYLLRCMLHRILVEDIYTNLFMSENQHGILDSGCHVFTLYNLCHYLRIVCVTISVDTFMSSHWSDLADRALSLAPEEVKFKQRLMIPTTTQSTLTLKLVKLYTSQLRDTATS